jgi:hypothetical protein
MRRSSEHPMEIAIPEAADVLPAIRMPVANDADDSGNDSGSGPR